MAITTKGKTVGGLSNAMPPIKDQITKEDIDKEITTYLATDPFDSEDPETGKKASMFLEFIDKLLTLPSAEFSFRGFVHDKGLGVQELGLRTDMSNQIKVVLYRVITSVRGKNSEYEEKFFSLIFEIINEAFVDNFKDLEDWLDSKYLKLPVTDHLAKMLTSDLNFYDSKLKANGRACFKDRFYLKLIKNKERFLELSSIVIK
ncbi:MAG: hypothetical protein IBX57_00470 [Gammaproteobacteria bacterium]|nr:hypothetical protein [Gammaproteobacteria bacterium]